MKKAEEHGVRNRRVFYIPGYDPFPPRRYRELYRREGAAQAAISGYELAIAPRAPGGPYGWKVDALIDGRRTTTDHVVLMWSDIVRRSMDQGIAATYLQLARTFWIYASGGVLWRLFRLRRGPVIAAMYPVAMLLAQLLLALGAAGLAAAGLALWLPVWLAVLAGAGVVIPLLRWFRRLDRHLYAHYLLHDYAFTAQLGGRYAPALGARLDEFAAQVAEALGSETDEVLVVGHSSGAHLAVSVLARVLRGGHAREGGPMLGLLTLGQVIPMQSFLRYANELRDDLNLLSQASEIAWIDITAPGDGCCYALCDPVSVSGAAGPQKRWPLVVSAAFSQTLRPETWKRLRRRYFRLHFQYLHAFDNPGDYDYFRITAGPRTLADRYRGRKPSASRKEAAISPHRRPAAA